MQLIFILAIIAVFIGAQVLLFLWFKETFNKNKSNLTEIFKKIDCSTNATDELLSSHIKLKLFSSQLMEDIAAIKEQLAKKTRRSTKHVD